MAETLVYDGGTFLVYAFDTDAGARRYVVSRANGQRYRTFEFETLADAKAFRGA